MVWIVISVVVVVVVWILLIKYGERISIASSCAVYYAEAKAALEKGKSRTDAIEAGLKQMQSHEFFNQLTDDDIRQLAIVFGSLRDVGYVGRLLTEAKRTNDISLLKDKSKRMRIAMNMMRQEEST